MRYIHDVAKQKDPKFQRNPQLEIMDVFFREFKQVSSVKNVWKYKRRL